MLEQLDQEQTDKGKEVSEGDSPTAKHIKERLADTHDALAEISLENERCAYLTPSLHLADLKLTLC